MDLSLALSLYSSSSAGGQPWFAAYAMVFDFENDFYRDESGTTTLSGMSGYAYTRSGTKGEFTGSAGQIFAADAPGIITGLGYFSRKTITCETLYSRDISNAAWTKRGTAAVTTDGTTRSDGTGTASLVTVGSFGANDFYQTVGGICPTMMIKRVSTTGVLMFANPSSAAGRWLVDMSLLSDGWERITPDHAAVTVQSEWTEGNGGGIHVGADSGGPISFYADFVHALGGSAADNPVDGGPLIETEGTAVTIGADSLAVSLTNGTYSAVYTFDDDTTQTIETVIGAGTYTIPVHETTLDRPLVKRITLAA